MHKSDLAFVFAVHAPYLAKWALRAWVRGEHERQVGLVHSESPPGICGSRDRASAPEQSRLFSFLIAASMLPPC